jgi:hypothetical protein
MAEATVASHASWQRTGPVSRTLSDTRVQLHWAAQAAAGIGRTLVLARPDDSHTSFRWDPASGTLLQECTDGTSGGLHIGSFSLITMRDGALVEELPLQGRTLDEGFAFFERIFGMRLRRPDVRLPHHAVSSGAAFDVDIEDLAELARHYSNAALICCTVFDSDQPVRCWPHHFDIAALLTLDGNGDEARSIGVGLSPGDGSYAEPYYYVNGWPRPDASRLPALPSGHWHTTDWTGAVLTATTIAEASDQEKATRAFVAEAVNALRVAISA